MTKEKIPKAIHTPPKKEQASVENQRRSSEDQHHTTKNKQDGVEAEERAALCIHLSRIGRSIKQEMNGEGSYSLDLKRWVIAKGKLVVISIIIPKFWISSLYINKGKW